jgi:hypothetical protein
MKQGSPDVRQIVAAAHVHNETRPSSRFEKRAVAVSDALLLVLGQAKHFPEIVYVCLEKTLALKVTPEDTGVFGNLLKLHANFLVHASTSRELLLHKRIVKSKMPKLVRPRVPVARALSAQGRLGNDKLLPLFLGK